LTGILIASKALVADGRLLSIGTANLDVRSFALNFEVNAFMYDADKAAEYRTLFEADLQACREFTVEEYRRRGHWQRFSEGVLRLFAPIM